MHECLTGVPPFDGDSSLAVMAAICADQPAAVATHHPDLPAPVAAVLERMLAKDPAQRPASADELALELGTLADTLAHEGVETGEIVLQAGVRGDASSLATAEQRVVSAILVSSPRTEGALPPPGGTWDLPSEMTRHDVADVFDEGTFPKISSAIAPFGARAERFFGTALLVTLVGDGTPTDHATRAARCALTLKAILPRGRFAVTTGRAVLEGPLPLRKLLDGAARVIADVEPGAIRVDDVTARLVESRFELDGGAQKHLLFEKNLGEVPRTVLGKEIPCVGRDRELGTLLGLWNECTDEPVARAVLVTAPAGGGKSRVRHELLDRIHRTGVGFELLVGRGDTLRAGAPFAMLGPAAFLGEIAAVPFPDEDLPALRAARQDPRLMADQTLSAWLDFLEAECAAHPVLVVLEDLHWGDAPSAQLVDAALRTLRERPLMVLAFARPEVDDKFANLWVERDLQRISLAPLTPRPAQKLVRHAVADLPDDQAAWIIERADGNPFYLEELVRAVRAGGGTSALPETVTGMVQARFDALGAAAKRVLRAAAVYGQTFRSAGVRSLLGGDPDHSLDQWLDILVRKEVLFARQAADTKELAFRHALLQEAAYDMLTAEDRLLGHRLAGEYLEASGEREAILLVEHYERGGDEKKAAHWCRFAAEQALEANDLKEVIARVERGARLGAEGEVLGLMGLAEAQARFWRGELNQAERSAQAAVDLCAGAQRVRAISELVAALGQQARIAEAERIVLNYEQNDLAPEHVGFLLRAAAYFVPAGKYQLAEHILARTAAKTTASPMEMAQYQEINGGLATIHF